MKFKIRYADQIVGFFSIVSLIVLVILVFALAVKQNWFTRKNIYYTEFESGSGIKVGMDINYKGFSIGKIKEIKLQHDKVVVTYYVLDDYIDYVKKYSLLEFNSNIFGLGTSFIFHPGNGNETLESLSEIYRFDSPEGLNIRESGLCNSGKSGDAIAGILGNVEPLLVSLTALLDEINLLVAGKGTGDLAETLKNVNEISQNITNFSKLLLQDDGVLMSIVGDKAFNELLQTLNQLQDVLVGIKNNPLIKNGVPDHTQEKTATPTIRSAEF